MSRIRTRTTLLATVGLAVGVGVFLTADRNARPRGKSRCPGGAITRAEANELASEPLFSVTDILLMKQAPNIGPNILARPAKGLKVLKAALKGKAAGSLGHTKQLLRVAEYCEAVAMHRWTAARDLDRRARRALLKSQKTKAVRLKRTRTRRLADVRRWGERGLKAFATIEKNYTATHFAKLDRVLLGGAHLSSLLAENYRTRANSAGGARAQALKKKTQEREAGMLQYLRRLLKRYPTSPYVPHAMAVMGDHYLNKGQTLVALKLFKRVTRFRGQSAVARYGHFGTGRSYMMSRRYTNALTEFFKVIQSAATLAQSDPLLEATQHGLVKAYANIGRPDKALSFFTRVAKGQTQVARRMFLLLGAVYLSSGRNADAGKVYARALTRWPAHPARCRWRKTFRALRSRKP